VIRLLIRARLLSLGAVLAALAALLILGRHVRYEQSLTSFFPDGDPTVIHYQKASALFGNDNFVFVGYDDPDLLTPRGMARLAELAASLRPERIEAVTGVESLDAQPLFWMVDETLARVESMPAFLRERSLQALRTLVSGGVSASIGSAVRNARPGDLPELRGRITSHPLLRGTLVNDAGTSTVLVVRLKGMGEQDVKATIAALREAADSFAARHHLERPALVGPPVLLADGFSYIEEDGRRLAVAGMALIGLVTLSATRSLWWAIVPIAAGWTVWLAAETALAVMGVKLSLSGGPLVAQIIVLTMPAASHLAIHFRDALRGGLSRPAAAVETVHAVAGPVLWCALTGALGYAALVTSNVVPVRQFGAVLAVCTLTASLLTLVVSPVAMRPPWRMEKAVRPGTASRAAAGVSGLLSWIERHPRRIVAGALLLVVPLAVGMVRLRYESNYIHAFKPDSRVVKDYRRIESRLGGIGVVSVVVPQAETLDMAALKRFGELERAIVGTQGRGVGRVTSALSLGAVLDPEGRLAALPAEKADHALKAKLDLIAAAPQGALLDSFWNRRQGWARVMVRVPEQQEAAAKEAAFLAALDAARGRFGPSSYLTGLSFLLTRTTRGVMATSWSTFLWAIGSILLMLALAYRGAGLAVLAILPSLLAVALVLGLMGWLGIKLDIATALVASVALGLSVDDTFHCLLQFRRHRARHDEFRASLLASYSVTGPGVLLSSLAVAAGFAVLWFSEFTPFANFGLMVGIATLGSSVGNLVLLPACLTLGHRVQCRKHAALAEPIVTASE
jgi:predicted RND superfamily exporter protein